MVTNLLATGAAFGVAKWIFQDGHLAGLLGFESQGFLDAWAPVFFFAMIFAISMDYTVFLLSSAKEHWDAEGDARKAMVGGLAHSGRVILAAGAVMVAVFFTFALSGPLPPKEMGVILGIAVLLDAFLVRLLLVPVLLRLAGPAAWYLPRWLDRILPDGALRPRRRDPGSEPGLGVLAAVYAANQCPDEPNAQGWEQSMDTYPVTFAVDYPDRPLNRLTTFFRIFTVIPIAIVLGDDHRLSRRS